MKKITLLAAFFAAFAMSAQVTVFEDDFELDIEDATTFVNWESLDVDGDGEFWEVFSAANVGDGTSSLFMGLGADSDSWEGSPFTPDNYLVTKDPIDLTGASGGTTLSFIVGSYQTNGTFLDDKYSIFMTASNDPADIVLESPVVTKLVSDDVTGSDGTGGDSAALITIDLTPYEGMSLYLSFRHWDSVDVNSVLIDEVSVDTVTLGVNDNEFAGLNHFINAEGLNLRANAPLESVSLFNVLGQQVIAQKLATTNEVVNISGLNAGVYIATVTVDGQTKSFKIVKK